VRRLPDKLTKHRLSDRGTQHNCTYKGLARYGEFPGPVADGREGRCRKDSTAAHLCAVLVPQPAAAAAARQFIRCVVEIGWKWQSPASAWQPLHQEHGTGCRPDHGPPAVLMQRSL
jgi:hypothetical protein